jgi:hypothetical protein
MARTIPEGRCEDDLLERLLAHYLALQRGSSELACRERSRRLGVDRKVSPGILGSIRGGGAAVPWASRGRVGP